MALEEKTIVDLREEMAQRTLSGHYTVSEVARMFGVSRLTVRKWKQRYQEEGRRGLTDRSHRVDTCPHRTSDAMEKLILAEQASCKWGSKKILQRLQERHPELIFPARSTVDGILARHGLVKPVRPRSDRGRSPFIQRYAAQEPAELTTIDHKGEFRLRNGSYCYPLTIMDYVSRYILACEALDSTSFERAWPVIKRVFRDHGLPRAMQSDNGPPFGASNGSFSRLSVELMRLDVQPVFSRPGVPQDNGRHERMHRDLKRETALKPAATLTGQQQIFDAFMQAFNVERPHEGLDMNRPARVYTASPRPYPRRRPHPEYAAECETRVVSTSGEIRWRAQPLFIGRAFAGETIALQQTEEQLWTVHYFRFAIGKLDESKNKFV